MCIGRTWLVSTTSFVPLRLRIPSGQRSLVLLLCKRYLVLDTAQVSVRLEWMLFDPLHAYPIFLGGYRPQKFVGDAL